MVMIKNKNGAMFYIH